MILFRLYVYLLCFKLILSKNDNAMLNISFSNSPDGLETLYLFSKFGLYAKNPERRIFGGEYVQDIKDYPFMAFLYLFINNKGATACGGSIIGRSYVLTAAHCLYFCEDNEFACKTPVKKHSRIYIGSTVANYAPQVSSVKRWHIHPRFKYRDKISNCLGLFDIGIVELDKPLQFKEEIFNVALPELVTLGKDNMSATKTTNFTKFGKMCQVLGWGKTSSHDIINAGTRQLKVATVPLIDAHQCNRYLMLTGSDRNEVMCRNSQICSLDPMNKNGVCNGDSGGPIMCDGVQIGIMSYVGDEKCVGPHIVNVYTRVDVNMKFIKDVMSKGSNFLKSPDASYTLLKLFYLICIVFNSL